MKNEDNESSEFTQCGAMKNEISTKEQTSWTQGITQLDPGFLLRAKNDIADATSHLSGLNFECVKM